MTLLNFSKFGSLYKAGLIIHFLTNFCCLKRLVLFIPVAVPLFCLDQLWLPVFGLCCWPSWHSPLYWVIQRLILVTEDCTLEVMVEQRLTIVEEEVDLLAHRVMGTRAVMLLQEAMVVVEVTEVRMVTAVVEVMAVRRPMPEVEVMAVREPMPQVEVMAVRGPMPEVEVMAAMGPMPEVEAMPKDFRVAMVHKVVQLDMASKVAMVDRDVRLGLGMAIVVPKATVEVMDKALREAMALRVITLGTKDMVMDMMVVMEHLPRDMVMKKASTAMVREDPLVEVVMVKVFPVDVAVISHMAMGLITATRDMEVGRTY